MASKLGRTRGPRTSLADTRLLARRCPAYRRREPSLRLSRGTWEGRLLRVATAGRPGRWVLHRPRLAPTAAATLWLAAPTADLLLLRRSASPHSSCPGGWSGTPVTVAVPGQPDPARVEHPRHPPAARHALRPDLTQDGGDAPFAARIEVARGGVVERALDAVGGRRRRRRTPASWPVRRPAGAARRRSGGSRAGDDPPPPTSYRRSGPPPPAGAALGR